MSSSSVPVDAILVFTPTAAERLHDHHYIDVRKNMLSLKAAFPDQPNPTELDFLEVLPLMTEFGTGSKCGIYVSGPGHKQLEYVAEVKYKTEYPASTLLGPLLDSLTFTVDEARKYITPTLPHCCLIFGTVKPVDPVKLEDLKKLGFNPFSGVKYLSPGQLNARIL